MNAPEISIIIPAYNAGEFIAGQLDSILQQTYKDFEIIVVDSNSTDDTMEVVDRYASLDGRVRSAVQRKMGVSAARNKGLDEATGRYIVFFDADDFVMDYALEKLVSALEENDAQLAVGGYNVECWHQVQRSIIYPNTEKPIVDDEMNGVEYVEALFWDDTSNYQGFLWDKIFIRSIIEDNHIRFNEDVFYNEDRLFVLQYALHIRKVKWIPEVIYRYQVRAGSAMDVGRGHFADEREMTELIAFENILQILENKPQYAYALENAKNNMAVSELRLFRRMTDKEGFARYRKSIFRKYARKYGKLGYTPQNYIEKVLGWKIIFYGFTGISYSKDDTRTLY
jgi:glycosyltransferase EpsH